jgi:colanic acid/amylovoran biosynthesis glycosyltransferase
VLSSNTATESPPKLRLGYLVPEFPGQTHSFFWREIQALQLLGAEPVLLSTRLPDHRLVTHAWASGAMKATVYLYPLTIAQGLHAVWRIVGAGPQSWARLLKGITSAGPKRWIRNAALVLLGARLATIARERGFSHVHVHSCADAAYIAAFAASMAPLSYSIVLHGTLAFYGPGQRFKWEHASFGLVVSDHLRQDVLSVLPGQESGTKIGTAPMGVDLRQFERSLPYTPWARGSEPLKLVSCGRLNAGKGHQDLIAAVDLLRKRGMDVTLRICGEDDHGGDGYRRDLERRIAELDLVGSVVLLGAVDESVVRRELAHAHIFALASHAEAIGVAYMEAMAMKMPVVGSKVGGVPDLIEDGQDGLLVPPANPEAVANAIEKIACDSALAVRLAGAARAKVEQQFSSERSAKAVIDGITRYLPAQ